MVRRSVTCALLVLLATAGTASARRCPNVMLVIDKSGSMLQDPSGGGQPPTKWDLVKTAVNQTVSRYAERVPLGLTTFGYLGAGACFADTTLEVDIKVNQGPVILQRLAVPPNPQASTNTGEGIRRAYTDSKFLADPARSNYLILITDGTPNCSKPEPDTTINFIKAAAAMNPSIHTFVVGFDAVVGGNGVDPGALNRMAVAGLEAQAGCDIDPAKKLPCYYSASDDATFIAAIDKIIGGVAGNTAIGACDDNLHVARVPRRPGVPDPHDGGASGMPGRPVLQRELRRGDVLQGGPLPEAVPHLPRGRDVPAGDLRQGPVPAVAAGPVRDVQPRL